MKRFIDEAYQTAVRVLNEHRPLLERIAAALLERETIDREDLDLLARDLPLPPRVSPPPLSNVAPPPAAPRQDSSGLRAPVLGAPPAEPAGA